MLLIFIGPPTCSLRGSNIFSATLIGTSAERVTGLKPHHVKAILDENNADKRILRNLLLNKIKGIDFIVRGRLEVRNSFNNEDEKIYWDFKINYIAIANPEYELEKLENMMKI